MAVIINDFEVVLDAPAADAAPPSAAPGAPAESAPPGSRPLTPLDLEMLERHLDRRRERLRAH